MEWKLGSGFGELEREQKKGRGGGREWWTIKHKGKWGGSETERDKVLLKSCFRLMAHLPKVSETLSAPHLNVARSLITAATDDTMAIDMTLSFGTFTHIGVGPYFIVWDRGQVPHRITSAVGQWAQWWRWSPAETVHIYWICGGVPRKVLIYEDRRKKLKKFKIDIRLLSASLGVAEHESESRGNSEWFILSV